MNFLTRTLLGTFCLTAALATAQESAVPAPKAEPPITAASLEAIAERIFVAKLIASEEGATWAEQETLFAEMIALREREIDEIDEFTEAARSRVDAVASKRAALDAEEGNRKAWRVSFEKTLVSLENSLRPALPKLPQPVRDKVEDSVLRLEADAPDDAASLQDRFRDLLTILSAIQDFSSRLTVTTELREIEGVTREIDVLYLGLSQAYFADRSGAFGGTGLPTSSGWQWTARPKLASAIRETIDVQRRESPPAMVTLPLSATVVE